MTVAVKAAAVGLIVLQSLASAPTVSAQRAALPARTILELAPPPSRKPVTVNRTLPHVVPPRAAIVFTSAPTDQEIFQARVFSEPFVPTGPTTPADNRAFADAIGGYVAAAQPDNLADFEAFGRVHPASVWRASILANAGAIYRRTGRITKALDTLNEAWQLTRNRSTAADAIGQFAMGESLDMLATLGQAQLIQKQLELLGKERLQGPAAAKAKQARFTLAYLGQHPDRVIPSGPVALRKIAALLPHATLSLTELDTYVATPEGMSLVELREMAANAGIAGVIAARTPESKPVVPSIVHLRIGHFSALVRHDEAHDRYLVDDPALGRAIWMDAQVLREETSDVAFLLDRDAVGWRLATEMEAKAVVGRSCPPGGPDAEGPCPNCPRNYGMAGYWFSTINAGLVVSDVPLAYQAPRGPAVEFGLTYLSRDAMLPQTFTFGNQGIGWFSSWLSYAEERQLVCLPNGSECTPEHVAVLLRGGGMENYVGPPDANGAYPTHYRQRATVVQTSASPVRYERRLSDGSVEVFGQPDGAPAGQRRVFLTQAIDPRGQALSFTYDSQIRLVAVTDAIGQVTTLSYDLPLDPLKLTGVTDPFGRSAVLAYNDAGRLISITDTIGLTSTFLYGSNDMIGSLTTAYGTTTFAYEVDTAGVYTNPIVQATDPLNGTEHLEFRWSDSGMADTEPSSAVPTGFASANTSLNRYNTVYWDKRAWSMHPGDTTKAVVTHWLLRAVFPGYDVIRSVAVPHSVKRPLENRVWYAYPGQPDAEWAGTHTTASVTARVLDDGTTQRWERTYNDEGRVLTSTDPLGRQTSFSYSANGIDPLEGRQTTAGTGEVLVSYGDYTDHHQPQTVIDAAGQSTSSTYSVTGQLLTEINAKQETTTYTYDVAGRLLTVAGPISGATTTFGYDTQGRLLTETDAAGYTITNLYDGFDRPTRTVYPDDTYEEIVYQRLDVSSRRDRQGRKTRYYYDSLRRLTATRDPMNRTTRQEWCACGSLDAIVDANGSRTVWERDLRGRVTREVRADGTSSTAYEYEPMRGRLKTTTDPKGQVTTYSYYSDDATASMVFTNATIATPSVSFTYDGVYGRTATMTDGSGLTSYTYNPAGQPGAGQVASIDGPLMDDTITYLYNELGRMTTRAINSVAVTWTVDALGRVISESNVLGSFTYSYDAASSRLAAVTYPNGQTSAYSYYPNASDHRLQSIHHKYPGGATLSKFDYTYDGTGKIVTRRQQAETTAVSWAYRYDLADQLIEAIKRATDVQATVLHRYAYSYDPSGNRTAEQVDDTMTGASYDSTNRILSQQPGGGLQFLGTVSEPSTVKVQGVLGTVASDNTFRATAPVTSGTNIVIVRATDASGNSAIREYEVDNLGSPRAFTFDLNGNLTSDGLRTFEWDARNQLVAVTSGDHRTEYAYDGQKRRVRSDDREGGVLQTTTRMIWCDTVLCEERDAVSNSATRRLFALGEQVQGQTYFVVTDHIDSVASVTNSDTTVVTHYSYDPWGRRTVEAGPDLVSTAFAGLRTSPIAALQGTYRSYDPELGRWTSEDPLFLGSGSLNHYRYVSNRPLDYVDPLGLFQICCRRVASTAYIGCHCFLKLSDGHTIGAYRSGSELTREEDGRDDQNVKKCNCQDYGGGRDEDEKLKQVWNNEPKSSRYGTKNTSNTAVSEALRPFKLQLPPCAWGRRYYWDFFDRQLIAIYGK